jgi:hypothetical protein
MQNALGFGQIPSRNQHERRIDYSAKSSAAHFLASNDRRARWEEVAKSLDLSVGAVYVAKSRVIARLKKEIQSVDAEGVTPPDFFV